MPVGLYPGANSYIGNGVTALFAYSFKVLAEADLKVVVDGVTKVLTTDYTVSGVGTALGGNVTFAVAPAVGAVITIERARAYKRDTDYQRSGSFDEETVDGDFDALVMLLQQIEATGRRSIKGPVSVVADQIFSDADWAARAGKFIRYKNDGSGPEFISAGPTDNTFTAQGLGALARSWSSKVGEIALSVKDFGCQLDGLTDDTVNYQKALDAIALTGGRLFHPDGDAKVTATLNRTADNVHWYGDGKGSSRIKFAPTANGSCVKVANGANSVWNWSIRDLAIYSDDNVFTKTALEIVDARIYELDNVHIYGGVVVGGTNMWSGANSIGLYIKGREMGLISHLECAADRPIVAGNNPNNSIDLDLHTFDHAWLVANANPVVEFENGVQAFNTKFTGAQSWNKGTHGFRWVDNSGVTNSYQISFENVRTEQGTVAAAYSYYIDHSAAFLETVSFKNCEVDTARNGFYLRNVRRVDMDTVSYPAIAGKTAIDMTAVTNSVLSGRNTLLGNGATVTLTGFVRVWEPRPTQVTYNFGEHFLYLPTARAGMRHSVVDAVNTPLANVANIDGTLLLENQGEGRGNAVIYVNGKQHRLLGSPSNRVMHFDDFNGDVIADQWGTAVGTDPQCVAAAILAPAFNGLVRLTTGDDAAATMAVNGTQLHSQLQWAASVGGLVFEVRLRISAITSICLFIGLTDQIAALELPICSSGAADGITTNASDAVGVFFDTNMATDNWWLAGVANNVDAAAQNSGVAPVAATYETWRIELAADGAATFYRNGTQVGVAMAGAVTAGTPLTPVIAAFSRTNASRNIDVDYVHVECLRSN